MAENQAEDTSYEEPEFVDQSVWVPPGQEIVPAALFLNRHALAVGKCFMSAEATLVDRLLASGRLDDSHHALALRIMNLLRLGTSKQSYSVMKIFMPAHGHDNSEFCPMTLFIRITRTLKQSELRWVRVICGLEYGTFEMVSRNVDLLKDALDKVEDNLYAYQKAQEEQVDAVASQ